MVAVVQRMVTTWKRVGKFTKEITTVDPGLGTQMHTIAITAWGGTHSTSQNTTEGMPFRFLQCLRRRHTTSEGEEVVDLEAVADVETVDLAVAADLEVAGDLEDGVDLEVEEAIHI